MPVVIRNKSTEPAALPYPLRGVLAPGRGVVLNTTAALVIAALGGTDNVVETFDIFDTAAPAAYDSFFGGDLQAQTLAGTSAVGVTGGLYTIYGTFTAATTGTSDDVLVTSSVPYKSIILDCYLLITTNKAAATGTLRDAASGAGNALSDAISVATTGVKPWAITSGPPTINAGSAIYLNRSDRAFAGTVFLSLSRLA